MLDVDALLRPYLDSLSEEVGGEAVEVGAQEGVDVEHRRVRL